MSDEREVNESDDAVSDLELTDEDADSVRGGDGTLTVSNVLKAQHDTANSTIGNIR
jgi:hypothetical protein